MFGEAAPAAADGPAPYDLTYTLSSYMDRHLVFPLIEWLQEKEVYPAEQLMDAKLQLLYPTNMVDFAMDVYKHLHNTVDVPERMVERREEVMAQLRELQDATQPLRELLEDTAFVDHLRENKNFSMAFLAEKHDVQPGALDTLLEWTRFQFNCGNYQGAAEYLHHYRLLCASSDAAFSASWGKLAAEILIGNWDVAAEELLRLRENTESRSGGTHPLVLLQQRSWLMHWALYVHFMTENGRAQVVDLYFQERYLNTLQTTCPHLLRYLVAALLLTPKRTRPLLPELARVVTQEAPNYSDPLTRFLKALVHDSDFDAALAHLEECSTLMRDDFFLANYQEEFVKEAKGLIFESYCRIHQRIDIAAVAAKFGMSLDDAERWVVNLVREAQLDARIDSQENAVVISRRPVPVYQKVLERTKGVQFRSFVLANTIEQRTAKAAARSAAAAAAPATNG